MDMASLFYSQPSNMSAYPIYQRRMMGGYTVYGGSRRQRGGGISNFVSFRNALTPFGRQALAGIKSIAKNKSVRKAVERLMQTIVM